MPPYKKSDSDGLTERELIKEILVEKRKQSYAFDRFTVEVTGVKYNGEKTVYDQSGGILGRMQEEFDVVKKRVDTLERGLKNTMRTIIAMLILIVLNGGITNIDKIVQMLEKLKILVP